MTIRWDNASPLPPAVAAAMVAAMQAMPSRAQAAHDAWWAAVLDDPRARPRKAVHASFVRLREHREPTIELTCETCGIERRSFLDRRRAGDVRPGSDNRRLTPAAAPMHLPAVRRSVRTILAMERTNGPRLAAQGLEVSPRRTARN
jgi:hypothetical protein